MKKNYTIVNANIIENWNNAMSGCDIQAIQKMPDQLVQVIKEGILGQQYEQLYEIFCKNVRQIEAWGNILRINTDLTNCKIFLYASYWFTEKLANELYWDYKNILQINEVSKQINQLRHSTHFYPLLQILAEKGEVSQGEIAKHLHISSNALSNFLRRNEKYHLWERQKYGKYNYYFLTRIGKEYYKTAYDKNLMSDTSSIQNLMLLALEAILRELNESEPKVENVFHYINERIGNSQVVVGNELEKVMVRRIFRRAEQKRWEHEKYYADMLKYDEEEQQIYDLDSEEYRINDVNFYAYM